ncbi:MAG: cytochrome b/b6 domain-containing protein [Burkholderiales bacterium]
MTTSAAARAGPEVIHSRVVRVTHWINALAILIMVLSGWRIYNASPLFDFKFPAAWTLGGWLAGAVQWHFAAMWVLVVNGLVYLLYSLFSGHLKRDLWPRGPAAILRDVAAALRGKLAHALGGYNAVQRAAYCGVIAVLLLIVLSGLAIWKPVQFQGLAALMGGYEGARVVHFICMALVVLFVAIHVVMVALVPKTFLPMLTGRARGDHS